VRHKAPLRGWSRRPAPTSSTDGLSARADCCVRRHPWRVRTLRFNARDRRSDVRKSDLLPSQRGAEPAVDRPPCLARSAGRSPSSAGRHASSVALVAICETSSATGTLPWFGPASGMSGLPLVSRPTPRPPPDLTISSRSHRERAQPAPGCSERQGCGSLIASLLAARSTLGGSESDAYRQRQGSRLGSSRGATVQIPRPRLLRWLIKAPRVYFTLRRSP